MVSIPPRIIIISGIKVIDSSNSCLWIVHLEFVNILLVSIHVKGPRNIDLIGTHREYAIPSMPGNG